MATKDEVENVITGNVIAIFSKTTCPFCRRAKTLVANKYPKVQTHIVELDERDDGGVIQEYLLEKTGQETVPNIFINQQHVGGYDDLHAKAGAEELDGLVYPKSEPPSE